MLTTPNKISACPGPLQCPPGASQESGPLLRPVKEEELMGLLTMVRPNPGDSAEYRVAGRVLP